MAILTVKQAAEQLQIAPTTVYNLALEGNSHTYALGKDVARSASRKRASSRLWRRRPSVQANRPNRRRHHLNRTSSTCRSLNPIRGPAQMVAHLIEVRVMARDHLSIAVPGEQAHRYRIEATRGQGVGNIRMPYSVQAVFHAKLFAYALESAVDRCGRPALPIHVSQHCTLGIRQYDATCDFQRPIREIDNALVSASFRFPYREYPTATRQIHVTCASGEQLRWTRHRSPRKVREGL